MSTNRSRKHGIFAIDTDAIPLKSFEDENELKVARGLSVKQAFDTVLRQMQVAGNRPRTIESYDYIFNQYVKFNQIEYVHEITLDSIYSYLDALDVAKETKLIRLKSLKAVLGKFFNNGWLKEKFWTHIQIKIDKQVKKGANEEDINKLIDLIDKTRFVGYRDAISILVMYRSGIRIRTLCELKEHHIDFENKCLLLDGSILKNHKALKLPLDEELLGLLKILINQNRQIRKHYNKRNTNVFISQNGNALTSQKTSNNAISKQLKKYAQKFGFENINAHSLRRAFAKNLLNKGANIALISKALAHSNLEVTTQYLDLDTDEVAESLRDYL